MRRTGKGHEQDAQPMMEMGISNSEERGEKTEKANQVMGRVYCLVSVLLAIFITIYFLQKGEVESGSFRGKVSALPDKIKETETYQKAKEQSERLYQKAKNSETYHTLSEQAKQLYEQALSMANEADKLYHTKFPNKNLTKPEWWMSLNHVQIAPTPYPTPNPTLNPTPNPTPNPTNYPTPEPTLAPTQSYLFRKETGAGSLMVGEKKIHYLTPWKSSDGFIKQITNYWLVPIIRGRNKYYRNSIRETWAKSNKLSKHFFVHELSANENGEKNPSENLLKEIEQFQDIILVSAREELSDTQLLYTFYSIATWKMSGWHYLLKTGYEYNVNFNKLNHVVRQAGGNDQYMGRCEKPLEEKYTYCTGSFVLSHEALRCATPKILEAKFDVQDEDMGTGILMRECNISATNLPNFLMNIPKDKAIPKNNELPGAAVYKVHLPEKNFALSSQIEEDRKAKYKMMKNASKTDLKELKERFQGDDYYMESWEP